MGKIRETSRGVVEEKDGYSVTVRDPEMQKLRDQYVVPHACPVCKSLMENWDSKPFYQAGMCADCVVDYIEGRDIPEEIRRDRTKLQAYAIEKKSEKEKLKNK